MERGVCCAGHCKGQGEFPSQELQDLRWAPRRECAAPHTAALHPTLPALAKPPPEITLTKTYKHNLCGGVLRPTGGVLRPTLHTAGACSQTPTTLQHDVANPTTLQHNCVAYTVHWPRHRPGHMARPCHTLSIGHTFNWPHMSPFRCWYQEILPVFWQGSYAP